MFINRSEAAHALLGPLTHHADDPDAMILAIPRGGLVLGDVLSRELHLPLEVMLTKKIGYPGHPEFAIGAVSVTSMVVEESYRKSHSDYIDESVISIRQQLEARHASYMGGLAPLSFQGRRVIITDDGVATGHTIMSAISLVRQEAAAKIVVAVPVGAPDTIERLRHLADEVMCLSVPESFHAVGQFYREFEQVSDSEAIRLFRRGEGA